MNYLRIMNPKDLKKWLTDKSSLNIIANNVSKKVKRKLYANEVVTLKKYVELWAKEYANQIEDPDDPDIENIQVDLAVRFYKVIAKRNQPPVAIIDTHEMLKSQIREDNVVLHDPSGYPGLKYQDDTCVDDQGNPINRFGGSSGRDFGLYGEQPTIVNTPDGYRTLNSIQLLNPPSDNDGTGAGGSSTADNSAGNATTADGGLTAFIAGTSAPQSSADRLEQLMIESNLMIEDLKLTADKMSRVLDFYFKRDQAQNTLPNDTDPSKVYFRDAYLHFDTRYRDLTFTTTENIGQFRWAVSNIPFLQVNGAAGVVFALEDIVEMEIDEFEIPADNTFSNYYNRASLYIEEITTQAVMSSENTRYHWLFNISNDGTKLKFTPLRRKMVFPYPIQYLVQSTFTFRSPYELIPFSADRLMAVATPGSNPVIWTTTEPHGLNTNDPVYFNDNPVSTGNLVIDSEINVSNGLQVIKLNSTQFTVPVDLQQLLVLYLQLYISVLNVLLCLFASDAYHVVSKPTSCKQLENIYCKGIFKKGSSNGERFIGLYFFILKNEEFLFYIY